MSTIIGIGATQEMEGFALAGVPVFTAATDAEVAAAWTGLGDDVGLVILSPAAARQLRHELDSRQDVLALVMP
ncbi:MAG: V-type ATP synthase subunit F [Acidimicrobiales bacterium]|jgi:vacuolar-type H+-ATPase subunit F/Vma7